MQSRVRKKPKYHPNTQAIYITLEQAIAIARLRQSDIAKILGVNQTTVSHHLANRSFDMEQLNKLLDYFGMEIRICAKEC